MNTQWFGPQPLPQAPRPRMRKGWIVAGIIADVVAVVLLVGGAIAMAVGRTVSSIAPGAARVTPAPLSFDAEAATYEILLDRRPGDDFRESSDVQCSVQLADGRTLSIDGAVQAVAVSSNKLETVGSFDAIAGTTTVACEANGGSVRYVVDEESLISRIGLIVVLVGVGLLLAGVAAIMLGVFWKKRPALA